MQLAIYPHRIAPNFRSLYFHNLCDSLVFHDFKVSTSISKLSSSYISLIFSLVLSIYCPVVSDIRFITLQISDTWLHWVIRYFQETHSHAHWSCI